MHFRANAITYLMMTTLLLSSTSASTLSNPGKLKLVAKKRNNETEHLFPLLECQGDCNHDDDCLGELKCFLRKTADPVPGCILGMPRKGKDYCVDPNGALSTHFAPPREKPSTDLGPLPEEEEFTILPSLPKKSFKLKLFWELGYMWQEEPLEKKFCMECEGGACKNNSTLYVRWCNITQAQFRFQSPPEINGSQIKLKGKRLCLERVNETGIHILRCNSTSIRQRWHAVLGSFNGPKFDIRPMDYNGCVTQRHHPKDKELIFVDNCKMAHKIADTGFWNRLY